MGIRYNPALDGLRAVAVLMVIAYHCDLWWVPQGYLGVDVFFVLSGYLITSILAREEAAGGIRLGAFYLRRARRLYPALLLFVGVMVAFGWANAPGAVKVLLYLSDYMGAPGSMSHTWSLAVEEHYYMLWPLALPFVLRLRNRAAWLLAAYGIASLWSAQSDYQLRFDTRMSGLVFGSLLAILPRDTKLPYWALGASVVLLVVKDGLPASRMFVEAATACFILLSQVTTLPFLTRPILTYVGRISYGMYLYHAPLAFMVRGEMPWEQRIAVVLLASLAAAALSYHTVEAWMRAKSGVGERRRRREVGRTVSGHALGDS